MRPTSDLRWQQRRAEIAERALSIYLEAPWPAVPLEELSDRTGFGQSQIYHSFDGRADIYRAAVGRLFNRLADRLDEKLTPCPTVQGTIRAHVQFAANVVRAEDYRSMVFLRLRDRHREHWLGREYRNLIANPFRDRLKAAVREASFSVGTEVMILHRADERFLQKLESALALPALLGADQIADENVSRTVNEISKFIWSSTQLRREYESSPLAYGT